VAVFSADRELIQTQGRRAGSALRVCEALASRPILTLSGTTERTGLSFPGASDGMKLLGELGIVNELTGKKRNRVYAYTRYLAMLGEGT
jgi:Fic family protein